MIWRGWNEQVTGTVLQAVLLLGQPVLASRSGRAGRSTLMLAPGECESKFRCLERRKAGPNFGQLSGYCVKWLTGGQSI